MAKRVTKTTTEGGVLSPPVTVSTPTDPTFQYVENPSIRDILRQSREYQDNLATREQRAGREAKIFAISDFARALGGLAGAGRVSAPFQESPYLRRAFSEIDQIRLDKERAKQYYSELERKSRASDFEQQFKLHQQALREAQRQRQQAERFNAQAQQRYDIEKYKAGQTKVSETITDDSVQRANLALSKERLQLAKEREERLKNAPSKARPYLNLDIKGNKVPIDESTALGIYNEIQNEEDAILQKAQSKGATPEDLYRATQIRIERGKTLTREQVKRKVLQHVYNNPERYAGLKPQESQNNIENIDFWEGI